MSVKEFISFSYQVSEDFAGLEDNFSEKIMNLIRDFKNKVDIIEKLFDCGLKLIENSWVNEDLSEKHNFDLYEYVKVLKTMLEYEKLKSLRLIEMGNIPNETINSIEKTLANQELKGGL